MTDSNSNFNHQALLDLGAQKHSLEFAAYWDALPKVDHVPVKSSFRPDDIPQLLPYVIIHELINPELIQLRLAGTSVVGSYGHEITGKNYLDFVEESRRPKASKAIFLVCEQPCCMLVHLQSKTRKGYTLMRESIAFPMRDEDGVARFVYFCSSDVSRPELLSDEGDELEVMTVPDRTYFDIGAGIPDFKD